MQWLPIKPEPPVTKAVLIVALSGCVRNDRSVWTIRYLGRPQADPARADPKAAIAPAADAAVKAGANRSAIGRTARSGLRWAAWQRSQDAGQIG
jgi:hypothetical protein